MEILRKNFITVPTLITFNYNFGTGAIIIRTDFCDISFGNTLKQIINNVKYLVRYKSNIWKGVKLNYNVIKLEC